VRIIARRNPGGERVSSGAIESGSSHVGERASPERAPRPWLAALFSLFTAGFGQLYAGRVRRGILLWITNEVVFGLALLLVLWAPGPPLNVLLPFLIALGYRALVVADAWKVARHWSGGRRLSGWRVGLAALAWVVAASYVGDATIRTVKSYVEAFKIPSGAMEPSLLIGDYLFVVKRREESLVRDGIVVYRWENDKNFMKRLVGLPGDTLQMRAGRLIRNGVLIAEPYARTTTEGVDAQEFDWQRPYLLAGIDSTTYHPSTDDWGPLVVPPARVFVLGDNRHNSLDSRYTGFIAVDDVLGRPVRIYFSRDPETRAIRWRRIGQDIH
jgi:signal peptidase I